MRIDGLLSLNGTRIDGKIDGWRATIGTNLIMQGATLGGPVNLRSTHVGLLMDMSDASVDVQQAFDAERLGVGRDGLLMRRVRYGGPVDLFDAHSDGQFDMTGVNVFDQQNFNAELLHVGTAGLLLGEATFGGSISLCQAHVNGRLALDSARFAGPVSLCDAQVDGLMSMEQATVEEGQMFYAQRLHVGKGGLFLDRTTFGGPVDISDARVDGLMRMERASVAKNQSFNAEFLRVGNDLCMCSVTLRGAVNLQTLTVDGSLSLGDSHVRQLDLAGAVIRDDLLLGGRWDDGSERRLHWDACDGQAPCLNLRNTKIGNLQDDETAWPERMTLEGFTFARLGGFGGEQRQDLRNRKISWWRDWLSRDPVYSAQPYSQLASVLVAAGNRDGAADIRFFGRDRERMELLRGCTWLPNWLQHLLLLEQLDETRPCHYGPGLGKTVLQLFVGYGIGYYAFRAAGWALFFALIGTAILLFAPGARRVRPT